MNLPDVGWRVGALVALMGVIGPGFGQASSAQISIQVDKPGIKISPVFYGLMTEEINHSYDGGLYGELIQNRSFRDQPRREESGIPHWSVYSKASGKASIALDNDSAEKTPFGVSLKLEITSATADHQVGASNDGYWGIPVKPNTAYRGSFFAKASPGAGPIVVSLVNANSDEIAAKTKVSGLKGSWQKFTFKLKTHVSGPSAQYKIVLTGDQPETIWFKDVSLFGPTFKNRPNGNRGDLMELLGEMKPSFLRLPGGNYLEGDTIPDRFNWKETIGDVTSRPGHQAPWGYRSSDGLGLLEYLEWCEDLKMQPLLAVYAGYSLRQQFVKPGPDLAPYVQDALDEIEYVTGSSKSKWGAVRAKNGHPKPFPLSYVEIGNEDEFDRSRTYDQRFAQFFDAIKAKYPNLQLIATAPVKSRKPDVIDDHYYRSAAEMARDSGHYDRYARTGSKIFVGEWASIGGNPVPTYLEALGDAAWLTGLERNSDLVVMEAYAPLLTNVNPGGSQWPTNLIGYDALTSFGSPSYYVQSMFAKNTGDRVLPVEVKLGNRLPKALPVQHGAVGVGTYRTKSEFKDIEVTAGGTTLYRKYFGSGTADWKLGIGTWKVEGDTLQQTSNRQDTHASAGSADWTDYTYRVKARKISGDEGFFVLFHVQNSRDYFQWNVGGWGNTRSAVQRHEGGEVDEVGESTNTTVESGRWYNVRIELRGPQIKCYLDDKLITQLSVEPRAPVASVYAAASRVSTNGDVFLKVVNFSSDAVNTRVNLAGTEQFQSIATGEQMVGKPEDVNSIQSPKQVSPKPIKIEVSDTGFQHEFPANSITVFRLKPKG